MARRNNASVYIWSSFSYYIRNDELIHVTAPKWRIMSMRDDALLEKYVKLRNA